MHLVERAGVHEGLCYNQRFNQGFWCPWHAVKSWHDRNTQPAEEGTWACPSQPGRATQPAAKGDVCSLANWTGLPNPLCRAHTGPTDWGAMGVHACSVVGRAGLPSQLQRADVHSMDFPSGNPLDWEVTPVGLPISTGRDQPASL